MDGRAVRPRASGLGALLPAGRDRAVAGADRRLGARLRRRVLRRRPPDARPASSSAWSSRRCSAPADRRAVEGPAQARAAWRSACSRRSRCCWCDEPFDGLDLRQTPRGGRGASRRTPRPGARCSCRSTRSPMPRASATGSCCSSGGRVRGEGTIDELAGCCRARGRRRRAAGPRGGRPCPHVGRPSAGCSRKEWRELLASRAWWVHAGADRARWSACRSSAPSRTYAELSGYGGTAAGVGEAFSPLVGVWAPTFSACELAAAFLLPFVAIRLVAGDRQSGALKLELQHPMPATWRVAGQGAGAAGRLARSRRSPTAPGGRCCGAATAAASMRPSWPWSRSATC